MRNPRVRSSTLQIALVTLVITVTMAPRVARAAPLASLVRVPISPAALAADPRLAGFQTWDVRVSLDPGARWFDSGIDARVTGGTFYNSEFGSTSPLAHLWGGLPQVRFDTFITQAADPDDDSTFEHPVVHSAFPYKPIRPPIFTDEHVSATYSFTSGHFAVGPGSFTVARLTASEGSVVTMIGYNAQDGAGVPQAPFAFTLVVPEPASLACVALAAAALAARPRRRGK